MTKAELVEAVAGKFEKILTKKAAGEVVEELFDTLSRAVKHEGRFSYPGFGTWTVRTRKARKGRNPQTGEVIKIKASKTVGFKPSREFKQGL